MSSTNNYGWPLQMSAETAGRYCDEPTTEAFLLGVAQGCYPPPSVSLSTLRWHRSKLNAAIDELHGLPAPAAGDDLIDLF